MSLDQIVPKRAEIQSELSRVLQTLPPQVPKQARTAITNALYRYLEREYDNLEQEVYDKIISDLPSYQGWPKDKQTRPREV